MAGLLFLRRGGCKVFTLQDNSHEAIVDKKTFEAVQKRLRQNRTRYQKRVKNHFFNGLIRCSSCGRIFTFRYANKGKYRKPIWICPTFNDLGKDSCPSQQIPESILIAKTKEVLALGDSDELTAEIIHDRIAAIHVPEHNHLVYELTDGTIVDVPWEHVSRSKSWTPEMRQAAREKTLKRNAERRKHDSEA